MKHVKKWVMVLVAMVMAIVAGCSGSGSKPAGDASPSAGGGASKNPVEITFWTISLSPTFDDYINGVIKDFETKNPGVKVKWQDVPIDAIEQKTLTSAASGTLADVMNLNTDYLKKLAALGAVANMDKLAGDVKKDFYEGIWSAGEFQGVSYALPWYLSNSVLLYNKDILKKAGFDNPPKTEEEAWQMSKVIKEKTGAYGSTLKDIHLYLPSNGVPLISDDFKKAAFNTPRALEIFKAFKQRYDDKLLPDEMLLGQAKAQEWYAQEKIAWWSTGPQLFRQVKDLSPQVYDKSDAAPALLGSTGKVHVAIMNIAVAEKSKHQKEAADFAKFITNAENQLKFSKIVAVLPSVKKAAEDPFFAEGKDSKDPAEKGRYFAVQQLKDSVNNIPPVENISKINKAINDEFHRVLLEKKDPAKALSDAEAEVNKLLK
ncbi:sugar ABC transporter substrate-binding protein [Paenibacillus sp. J31TS4]|uniref:ABC transporter substrate-binding protein n=1 Tax=Paenibacillus sp. J31TS4 TaxID=2807195 RepID=UPI001B070170|nr:sugar ABC transporter substrate-binding protein [Paenibacillus sp. J31TS4]GIP38056.1 sugar ABC transporter substrate-binding protein [Paenibacillus sp. J31TS4]